MQTKNGITPADIEAYSKLKGAVEEYITIRKKESPANSVKIEAANKLVNALSGAVYKDWTEVDFSSDELKALAEGRLGTLYSASIIFMRKLSESQVSNLSVMLADVASESRTLREQVGLAKEQVEQMKVSLNDASKEAFALQQKIDNLKLQQASDIERLRGANTTELGDMRRKHSDEMALLNAKLSEQTEMISSQAERLEEQNRTLGEYKEQSNAKESMLYFISLENNTLKKRLDESITGREAEKERLRSRLEEQAKLIEAVRVNASELSVDISVLKQRNQRLSEENSSLMSLNDDLRTHAFTLSVEVTVLKTEVDKLKIQLSTITESRNEQTLRASEAERLVTDLRSKFDKSHALSLELSQQIDKLHSEHALEIKRLNEGSKTQLDELTHKHNAEMVPLKGQLADQKTIIDKQTEQLEKQLKELNASKEELAQTKKELESLTLVNEGLLEKVHKSQIASEVEKADLLKQLEAQGILTKAEQLKVADLQQEVVNIKDANTELQSKLKTMSEENASLRVQVLTLTDEVKELKRQLETKSVELENEKQKVTTLSDALTAKDTELTSATEREQKLKEQLVSLQSEHESAILKLKEAHDLTTQELNDKLSKLTREYTSAEQVLQESLEKVTESKALLEKENTALKAELKATKSTVSELEDQVSTLTSELESSKQAHSTTILSQLEDFVKKTTKDKWKADSTELKSIAKDALDHKIKGYEGKLDALKAKESEITSSDGSYYEELIKKGDAFIARLKATSDKKISSEPEPEPAAAPSKSSRWAKIYASHEDEKDHSHKHTTDCYTKGHLFKDTKINHDIALNMTATELTSLAIEKFKKGAIPVVSPSGQKYSFSAESDIPKAVLTAADTNTKVESDDTDEHHHQRLAVTVVNMIQNVLSKSESITIDTPDPFVATVAKAYIDHLNRRYPELNIQPVYSGLDYSKLETTHSKEHAAAKNIVDEFHAPAALAVIKAVPAWLDEALKIRSLTSSTPESSKPSGPDW